METLKDNNYDVIVECKNCHDLYDCVIQLYSVRELALMKEFVEKMFYTCHRCGPTEGRMVISICNGYFSADEYQMLKEIKRKNIFNAIQGMKPPDND